MDQNAVLVRDSHNKAMKYLQDKLVIILHEYRWFNLCLVKYLEEEEGFVIDRRSLTEVPIEEHTLNLRALGGLGK